jgi:hypothetical protein
MGMNDTPAPSSSGRLATKKPVETRYSNWLAKLLLSRMWERQHNVAMDPPRHITGSARLLSKTFLPSKIDRSAPIKAPIFILGTPRCGSTLLQDLLCRHERVGYINYGMDLVQDPELFYAAHRLRATLGLDVRGERYLQDSILVHGGAPAEAMRFWGTALKLDPHLLTWPQRRASDFTPAEIEYVQNTIRHVLYCFHDEGRDRFLTKCPALLTEPLLLQDIFPDAKFIHLVRDGRMVANSLIKLYELQVQQDIAVDHPVFKTEHFVPYPRVPGLEAWMQEFGPSDLRTTAHIWDSAIRYIDSVRGSLRNFHEIRYEDLCAAPAQRIDELLEFCELPPPGENNQALKERLAQVGTVSHVNRYGGFEQVEAIAGDSLRRYHYL